MNGSIGSLGLLLAGAASLAAAPPPAAPAPVRFAWFDYRGQDATFERAGKGDYANPILAGFYPDPSIVRVGADFYLVNSTFAYFPGLPVFRSRDLVHWTQIGNAIDRPSQVDFAGRQLSEGLFAPALHHAGGRFYIVNTCVGCGGNFIVTARDPAGPWSDPVWLRDVGGIDPSLFTDTDGTSWLVNNDLPEGGPRYEGHRAIWVRRFDLAAMRTAGPARMLVDGVDPATRPIWAEGPHLFRHDGTYYLMTAEGGTAANHAEVVYRSLSPMGPFEPLKTPILTQRGLDPARPDPVTSAGHAQLVETAAGDWWAVFLATRPYAGDLYNTGRETFLLRARWQGGWPVILPPRTPIPYAAPAPALAAGKWSGVPLSGDFTVRERFGGAALPRSWMMVRTPRQRWWRTGAGGLSLVPRADPIGGLSQPSFVARRQQHLHAIATTQMTLATTVPGEKAGLVAYQNEAHYYFVGIVDTGGGRVVRVERRADGHDPLSGVVLAERALPNAATIRLRIVADGGRYAFDYAAAPGARWTRLLDGADGTVLSTARAGGFVGTTLGLYAFAP